jgi:hypothetical protein
MCGGTFGLENLSVTMIDLLLLELKCIFISQSFSLYIVFSSIISLKSCNIATTVLRFVISNFLSDVVKLEN